MLMGWVNRRRDLGNLIFIDVRDRTGITQVVFDRERSPRLHDKAAALRSEFVIAVIGKVEQRDPDTVNRNLGTGEIEVVAEELLLLNESKNPPFLPSEQTLPNEEVRLKYRYIDLRRGAMQANIELRHNVALAIRQYLASRGFLEVETPFLTRSTPEGARDFLVPSRVQPGSFYALPQSPQLFKQILMISGFDQYFQIVRCFRDEDLRADRQLEFTQVDLEMSFPQQERVFEVTEGFLKAAFAAAGGPSAKKIRAWRGLFSWPMRADSRPGGSPRRSFRASTPIGTSKESGAVTDSPGRSGRASGARLSGRAE